MASVNAPAKHPKITTHEGAPAVRINAEAQLRRSVLSCLLWEKEFYEDGAEIATRIRELAKEVKPEKVAALAVEARSKHGLRHAPLWLTVALAEAHGLKADTLAEVCRRADEPGEWLAMWWKNGKRPIPAQAKKGLAKAMLRFDAYQLAKYDRAAAVRLRDVLFLTHAKPRDEAQAATWKALVDGALPAPDTWEVALSGGQAPRETWERLIGEGKLGYIALLRNLRNMEKAGVSPEVVEPAIRARKGAGLVLPFRYVAAARAVPRYEPSLDDALLAGLSQEPRIPGHTVIVVDVSGSMASALSAKSDMTRSLAASALAAIAVPRCEQVTVFATAGNDSKRVHATKEMPPRSGMAMVDAIEGVSRPLGGGGIFLKQAMDYVEDATKSRPIDRVIVITDEQDCAIDPADSPKNAKILGKANYMINVASAKNGIGYGKWTHIDGFSESVLRFIVEAEQGGVLD